ncbi:MAG: AfsR/SARP family transcriptional regulator [Jatrophihabitans sp.]
MQIKVLGQLSIRRDSVIAVPSARKPRKVLSLLLLNDCRTVSAPVLMTELWGDAPPKSGPTTLQTYVLHLRKLFAHAFGLTSEEIARELLQTRNGGYAFMVGDGELDLHIYQRARRAGDLALARRDDRTAVGAYQNALDQWQGSALMDVEHGSLMQAEVARLEQSRLTVIERKIEAELRLGRHRDALSELAALVLHHPFHEDLHAHFMLALYRSGNRNHALEVFHRLRASMFNELGLEPAPKLQRLHSAILAAEPRLDLVIPEDRRASVDALGR